MIEVPGNSVEGYRQMAEPICQEFEERVDESLYPRHAFLKTEMLISPHRQARIFSAHAKVLRSAVTQLELVPRPEADAANVAQWLGYLKRVISLNERISNAYKTEDGAKAHQLLARTESIAKLANEAVSGFDFHYCRLETAKKL